ncbi:MAG: Tetratricopeptide repeat [Verrucomicrobiota bacterium]|jgi:tetratricopeptide (TPR) repeat protein
MDTNFKVPMGFVQRRLPWILGGALLVVFLFTTGLGTSPNSILALGRVAGWDWRPVYAAPLQYVVTWPIGLLPGGLQLAALNLLSAGLGALAIALLARSVSLLPHDRTKEQRQLERSEYSLLSMRSAWLPPTLAALVCGLQLTFWENATAATGEMLDLVVFAWLIRSLLEFRLDHREGWLLQFAFVYGLGVANNYALIGFFPGFLAALVWIKWATFFNWRFVLRLLLCGVAGLLLYLLLPLVGSLFHGGDYTFWEMLRTYLGQQKSALGGAFSARVLILFLCWTSVLPILFIGIRWPASFGDVSPVGQALTNLTTHFIHLFFLAVCLYVTLDLDFSPRGLTRGTFALLPVYYLGALAIGYVAGYVLLLFGSKPDPNLKAWQRPSAPVKVLKHILHGAIWVVLVAMPVALVVQNLPRLRESRGPALDRLSQAAAKDLPATGAVVLADDIVRLYSLQETLRRRSPGHAHILVESGALQFPAYHRHLQRQYGARWPKLAPQFGTGTVVDPVTVINILAGLGQAQPLRYLNPSFGYFFEAFYLKPAGAVYEMKLHPAGAVSAPVLSAAEIQAQHTYWQQVRTTELAPLVAARAKADPASRASTPAARSRSPRKKTPAETPVRNDLNSEVAAIQSRALNHFAVEVQRAGNLPLAAEYFRLAIELNPLNPAALINLEYNRSLQAGKREALALNETLQDLLRPFGGNSDALLNLHGPPDEPGGCYFLAQHFSQRRLFRQSAQYLERTLYFSPTNITAHLLYIAQILQMPMPARAMELVTQLRARPPVPLSLADQLDLTRGEAWAMVGLTNVAGAHQLLEEQQRRYPAEPVPYLTQVQIYEAAGRLDLAMAVLERQLKVQADNYAALVNLAAYQMRSGRPADALPLLDRALKGRAKDPAALLNRALANLNLAQQAKDAAVASRHVEAALGDYRELEATQSSSPYVLYGLAECYRLKKMRTEALRYYGRCQKLFRAGTPERRSIDETIDRIKAGSW